MESNRNGIYCMKSKYSKYNFTYSESRANGLRKIKFRSSPYFIRRNAEISAEMAKKWLFIKLHQIDYIDLDSTNKDRAILSNAAIKQARRPRTLICKKIGLVGGRRRQTAWTVRRPIARGPRPCSFGATGIALNVADP